VHAGVGLRPAQRGAEVDRIAGDDGWRVLRHLIERRVELSRLRQILWPYKGSEQAAVIGIGDVHRVQIDADPARNRWDVVEVGRQGQRRRPRTEQMILDATRQILAERGVRGLTVDSIAARTGVATTTIHRRYRSKNDLALAVLINMVDDVAAMPDVGDTRGELVAFVVRTVETLHSTLMGRVMQGLVSDLAADPELVRAYRERVVGRRLSHVRRLVERGIARGDLRPETDPDMVTALLLGPAYYGHLLSGAPMDDTFGDRLVAAVLPGFMAVAQPDR